MGINKDFYHTNTALLYQGWEQALQNTPEEALKIIENVITCANVFASLDVSKRPKRKNDGVEGIYLKAYNELVAYLRQLFIHYNDLIAEDDLKDIENWEWAKLFLKLQNDTAISRVYIITYNYDIWIERVLGQLKIDYTTYLGTDDRKKFLLLKPHGSISFIHKKINDIDAFELKNSFEHTDAKIEDFKENLTNLLCNPTVIPLIPPQLDNHRGIKIHGLQIFEIRLSKSVAPQKRRIYYLSLDYPTGLWTGKKLMKLLLISMVT